eukprot:g15543.t2
MDEVCRQAMWAEVIKKENATIGEPHKFFLNPKKLVFIARKPTEVDPRTHEADSFAARDQGNDNLRPSTPATKSADEDEDNKKPILDASSAKLWRTESKRYCEMTGINTSSSNSSSSSSMIDLPCASSSDLSSNGAIRGGGDLSSSNEEVDEEVGPAGAMGWGEGGQAIKPPRSSSAGLPPADSGGDRKRSLGGTDVDRASDVAMVQQHHTCDRASPKLASEGPIALVAYGTSAAAAAPGSLGSQEHKRGTTTFAELLGVQEETMRDLSTPLASAGAGDVGAECDATPLHSRPPRGASRSQGNVTVATMAGGGGGGAETASEEAASASGVDSSSNGEGMGALKRKETITWESFLANISVSDGAMEDGRAKGEASSSDSSSPMEVRLPREASIEAPAAAGHSQPGSTTDQTARTRYLRAMASNAGAVPWNNGVDGEEGGDEESVGETGSIDMLEGRERTPPKVPHMLSDLSDRTFSPRSRHLDLGRSQSLSSVGLGSINNVRKTMERGINKFNVNPRDGISYLVENGLILDTAESICDFLSTGEGLSKRRIGEYFGRDNPKVQEVLRLFLEKLNFQGTSLDEALRSMVVRFRLPGEAQQMDRIMQSFAKRYHQENPDVFSCSDTAWVLAFGLMILNTDMYNRNIKESDKMTEAQFVRNHRGIDQGNDPARELLEGMYRRVKANEIRMDEGDMYESEVITFVAPKKSGWLKKKSTGVVGKWKRHWFVLNDAVLYYFISPQHQDEAPRCIIPLEGINVSPIGATDLSIGLRTNQGYVKSVKMADTGRMVQGTHRSFVLRAESMEERDVWVEALRAEVPAFHMELSASRSLSATPATSSAPTPIGTPSDSGRRVSKFGTTGRRRRHTVDAEVTGQMPQPVIRGWAQTQSDQHQNGGRHYMALFRDVGPGLTDNVVYFFGDAAMCDKMIGQHLRTSHGCLTLSDVTRVQLRQEEGGGGGRAIALQTGTGKHVKEMVIVPEEQRDFVSWTSHIKQCCPENAWSIAADGTPMTSSIGDTAINIVDSNGEGVSASVTPSIADHIGMHNAHDNAFVTVGIPSTVESVAGTADSKGRGESSGSDAYGRSESSETQPVEGAGVTGGGSGRIITTASSVTEADSRTEPDTGADAGRSPQSPGLTGTSRIVREGSMPGTDVE